MRATRTLGAALIAVLTLAACVANEAASTSTSRETAPTTMAPVTSTVPPIVECPGSGEFQEGTGIADVSGEDSDGRHLRRISWATSDRCESFSFDFETSEGAPAISVPDLQIDHLESFQVIRIRMDIDSATVTDQLVETDLVDRLYVVKGLDGAMFVDLHLKDPAAARARIQSSPARLTLDLKPGFVPMKGGATTSDDVVVVSPPRDAQVGLNPVVAGYARTAGQEILIMITQGDLVGETSAALAEGSNGWREFETPVSAPSGEFSLFVGQASPKDGTLSGVAYELNSG